MNIVTEATQKAQYIKDEKGNDTYAVLPIERYSYLIKIEKIYKSEKRYIPNEKTQKAIENGLKEKEQGFLKGYTDINQMIDDILIK